MTLTRSLDKRGGFTSVFIWQLRRGMPAAVTYWALMVVISVWDTLIRHGAEDHSHLTEVLITLFAFLMPVVYLGDCFSRRQADFAHALPIPRGRLYLSALINTLWQILLPIIPCRLCTAYMRGWRLGYFEGSYRIRALTLIAVAMVGFAFLLASACGTYHGYILAAIAHIVSWRLIVTCTYWWVTTVIPGTHLKSYLMSFFYFLLGPGGIEWEHPGEPGRTLIYCWLPVFGGICSALGYALYKRRRSEQAGHFGQCRPAEIFLRSELTLVAGMAAVLIVASAVRGSHLGGLGVPLTLGSMVLAAAGAHVLTELVWHRRLKALRGHLHSLAISGGLLIAVTAVISTGLGLDTYIPEVSRIDIARVSFLYPMDNSGINDHWTIATDDGEAPTADLACGLQSPEMLDKLEEFCRKHIELQRAAQYPYLPGRGAYDTLEYASVNYTYNTTGWRHVEIHYDGPLNARTEQLYEELKALRLEIVSSPEYVNGMRPLNAVDAVVSVGRLELDHTNDDIYDSISTSHSGDVSDSRSVEELPKDFIEGLEAALREDFQKGRYTTQDGLRGADYPVYQLDYKGEFTARGGLIWDIEKNMYVPAEGRRFELYDDGDHKFNSNVFRVTKEMPTTYDYLNEIYK